MHFSPWDSAILSCRGVVTNVFIRVQFSGFVMMPLFFICVARYSAKREPIILPVRSLICPLRVRMATPILSASGSVAIRQSAPVSRILAIPMERVSAYSGLGCFTVGKRGSIIICSSTNAGSNPKCLITVGHNVAPVPCTAVNTAFGLFTAITCLSITQFSIDFT